MNEIKELLNGKALPFFNDICEVDQQQHITSTEQRWTLKIAFYAIGQ